MPDTIGYSASFLLKEFCNAIAQSTPKGFFVDKLKTSIIFDRPVTILKIFFD